MLLSGSMDRSIRIWRCRRRVLSSFHCETILEGHTASILCITTTESGGLIASGAADVTIKIWQARMTAESIVAELVQSIDLSPKFFPVALSFSPIGDDGGLLLAVSGTKNAIEIYVSDGQANPKFTHQAILSGHDGWIRSLDFTQEGPGRDTDILLASASHDKYIRLWRVRRGDELPAPLKSTQDSSRSKTLSNKAHRLLIRGATYSLTFEALLLGHEDWIYTASWSRGSGRLRLISASADNSLAVWEPDPTTGLWLNSTRLGEISVQKGSTTATGSTGGFWIGLWSPGNDAIMTLGRTGSWRLWTYDQQEDRWNQGVGLTGHVKSVAGIAWSKDGAYLLSTSTDQTTRLHAEWKRGRNRSWHEFSRPQIHGYDLNCIDTLQHSQFISGADEKLLRVFNEPGTVAEMLARLCKLAQRDESLPDAANMPVLGLSNKAIEAVNDEGQPGENESEERDALDPSSVVRKSTLLVDDPPPENLLSRHTLWPEAEKLYGHGYEISAVAASHDTKLVATACKASSIEHAVIRLYGTSEWRQISPPLTAHSLTVTCLRFNDDDSMLLSVSRDRQWSVFRKTDVATSKYEMMASGPKAHTRMILAASWAASNSGQSFVTAGRDKCIKLWVAKQDTFTCRSDVFFPAPVTAVDFSWTSTGSGVALAVGTELGEVSVFLVDMKDFGIVKSHAITPRYSWSLSNLCRS